MKSSKVQRCQVCEESEAKYRCPRCLIPFCSVSCSKKHNLVPCSAPVTLPEVSQEQPGATGDGDGEDGEGEGVISDQLMEHLATDPSVQEYLKDQRFRAVLRSIDSSKDRRRELERLMKDGEFVEFADAVLDAVEFHR
mmetsp:Transcript_6392/g.19329  ORF Transcript_6392/g.19329 Transcript_6392/m.19329 type:complete len:138 (+) Transcript_6392:499-912(+)